MFDSFESWQSHEMDRHRRQWACQLCGVTCKDYDDTRAHLLQFHGDIVGEEQIDIILKASSSAAEHLMANECPFCTLDVRMRKNNSLLDDKEPVVPCKKFMKHLGRHLEEFSLLVFPGSELHGNKSNEGTERVAAHASCGEDIKPPSARSTSILPIAEDSKEKFHINHDPKTNQHQEPRYIAEETWLPAMCGPPQRMTMPNWQPLGPAIGACSNQPFAEAAQPASTPQDKQRLHDLEPGYTAATADLGLRPGFRTLGGAADSSVKLTDALRLQQNQYVQGASRKTTNRAPGLNVKSFACPECKKVYKDAATLRWVLSLALSKQSH